MHPDEMVSRYESVLYARAMRLVRSRSDALDLLQDTYERALRGQGTFQPGTNLRHWLMTIMYNLFLDRCRRQSREPRAMCIDEHEVASPEADAPEPWETITDEQIHAALADLERPFREVYELRLLGNCSYDEIADRLTIPRSTVGTRLMRARRKLRETLLTEEDPRCGTGRRLPKPLAGPRIAASTAT
ncbi:MAG: RNA polymerase sigma factor [Polyangia bacterium]